MDTSVVHSNPWFSISITEIAAQSWYRVERSDSAMIVGRTPDERILVLRGTRDTTGSRSFYEFPSGAIEPDETLADAAIRETREESGYSASSLVALGSFVESPGISASRCHVFSATLEATHSAALEPGEDWTPSLVTLEELWALVRGGDVIDGGTLAALALCLGGR
jgi:ADP-ribose pyrophosphatase